jgi:hypothetical protein
MKRIADPGEGAATGPRVTGVTSRGVFSYAGVAAAGTIAGVEERMRAAREFERTATTAQQRIFARREQERLQGELDKMTGRSAAPSPAPQPELVSLTRTGVTFRNVASFDSILGMEQRIALLQQYERAATNSAHRKLARDTIVRYQARLASLRGVSDGGAAPAPGAPGTPTVPGVPDRPGFEFPDFPDFEFPDRPDFDFRLPDRPDFAPIPRPDESGRVVGDVNFGGVSQSLQFGIATPLLEASENMLDAATMMKQIFGGMLGDSPTASLGSVIAPFTNVLERMTPVLERLLVEGVSINLGTGDGDLLNRNAALRGLV